MNEELDKLMESLDFSKDEEMLEKIRTHVSIYHQYETTRTGYMQGFVIGQSLFADVIANLEMSMRVDEIGKLLDHLAIEKIYQTFFGVWEHGKD